MDNLYSALSWQIVENRLRIGPNNEDKFYNDFIPIGSDYQLYLYSSFPLIRANLLSGDVFHLQFVVSGFHNKVTLVGEDNEKTLTKEGFLDLVRKEHPKLFEWIIWNLVGRNEE